MAGALGAMSLYLRTFWRSLVLVLTPLLAALVFLYEDDPQAMKCAYILVLMAVFWVTEVFPVAVTALIPVAAFPLMGVMSTSKVAVNYMKAINFLFMGGLMMAIAVENSGLHRRISLSLLLRIGTRPVTIMFSFMVTTAFLSMWISNTAATAMMIPIVEAVVRTIDRAERQSDEEEDGERMEMKSPTSDDDAKKDNNGDDGLSASGRTRRRMLMLSVAYAANVGGTGVMTGSPPNLVLPAKLLDLYPDHPLSFPRWMMFSVPLMVLNLVLAFLWLSFYQWWTNPERKSNKTNQYQINSADDADGGEAAKRTGGGGAVSAEAVRAVIASEYDKLGGWTVAEATVGICFAVLVSLWFFRNPRMFPGWLELFPYTDVKIHDASATVLVVLVVFALPSSYGFWPFRAWSEAPSSSAPLLQWGGERGVEKRLQWGVILLLGGGFALSEACTVSGFSHLVGAGLSRLLDGMPAVASMFVVSICTAMATEFASNTATANILVPILLESSKQLCLNPIFIAFPAILSCSYAFMLPAATAPNAIVKEAAGIPTHVMMKAGLAMNFICVVATVLVMMTLGGLVFDFGQGPDLPQWLVGPDQDYQACAAAATA